MRIAAFDDDRIGVIGSDETVVDVTDLLQQYDPLDAADLMPDLISHFDDLKPELERRVAAGGGKALDSVKLQSPLKRPTKIVCLQGNYREGTDRPKQALDFFFKSQEGIVGDGDTCVLPPHQATIFHHEAEIAIVVGKESKDLSDDQVQDAIFGYTCYNDVSARGLGRTNISSFLGKSFDTFAGIGPWIVTKDAIDDVYSLQITASVNGELRQNYNTADMEHQIDTLMTHISSVMTLNPGDLICCGTNHQGLGSMQDGDAMTTAITGIGEFTLHVKDGHARAWQRGIDEEMAARQRAFGEAAAAAAKAAAEAEAAQTNGNA